MGSPSGSSTGMLKTESSSKIDKIGKQFLDTRQSRDLKLRFPLQIDPNARSDQDDEFDNSVIDALDAQFRGTLRLFHIDEDSSLDRFPKNGKEEVRSSEFSSCSESLADLESELPHKSSRKKDERTCAGGKKENAKLQQQRYSGVKSKNDRGGNWKSSKTCAESAKHDESQGEKFGRTNMQWILDLWT